jgi:hypothetical protein
VIPRGPGFETRALPQGRLLCMSLGGLIHHHTRVLGAYLPNRSAPPTPVCTQPFFPPRPASCPMPHLARGNRFGLGRVSCSGLRACSSHVYMIAPPLLKSSPPRPWLLS